MNGLNINAMPKNTYNEDQGLQFGQWTDDVSRLMYRDVMPLAVSQIDFTGSVADYGGANGIVKDYIPQAVSIDIDESKQPDIVDDITTHQGNYDIVLARYVLHYLDDEQVRQMASIIQNRLVVIQFTNEANDLAIKRQISDSNEAQKHFRTKDELYSLFTDFTVRKALQLEYTVTPEFYKNRLQIDTELSHQEQIQIIEMEKQYEA